MRSQLGIVDNARRYARDAYALSVLLHARESVTLIVGRRTAAGDPLKPSRLLFATEPPVIAERVIQFYGDSAAARRAGRPPLPSSLTTSRQESAFRIPRPIPLDRPVEKLRVTEFRSYLTCPYRYYLSYGLGLESRDDRAEELSGMDFGNLVHAVLDDFGNSPCITSSDAREIRSYLDDRLEAWARLWLGKARRAAVHLQLEQLRHRLHAFAVSQAELVDFGWETHFIEISGEETPYKLDLEDGREVALSGRIDRIDYLPREDRWRIIDYKTESKGTTPEAAHRRKETWIDLQLPLYRLMAQPLGVQGQVELAYFLLPERSDRTRVELATWTEAELASADEVARETARNILDGKFWPPEAVKYDDWMAICQCDTFDGEPLSEPAEEVAP